MTPTTFNKRQNTKKQKGCLVKITHGENIVCLCWRKSISFLLYLVFLIPIGLTLLWLLSLFGLYEKEITLPLAIVLLTTTTILAIFDYYNRKVILQLDLDKVTIQHGVFLLRGITFKSIRLQNIHTIGIQSKTESSGDPEGPNLWYTHYAVCLTSKSKKNIILTSGLKETEATFLSRQINKWKDRVRNREQSVSSI